MPLTLILMRHAKSSWDDPLLDDFDRTLNRRGRESAEAIGAWLRKIGYLPEEVLVSGARRTVETWSRMAADMPDTATMQSNSALYHASADIILGVLKGQTQPNLMMICHNPGIADFANRIVTETPAYTGFRDFPTAATAIIEFDAEHWSGVEWHSGRVLDFAIPQNLIGH